MIQTRGAVSRRWSSPALLGQHEVVRARAAQRGDQPLVRALVPALLALLLGQRGGPRRTWSRASPAPVASRAATSWSDSALMAPR